MYVCMTLDMNILIVLSRCTTFNFTVETPYANCGTDVAHYWLTKLVFLQFNRINSRICPKFASAIAACTHNYGSLVRMNVEIFPKGLLIIVRRLQDLCESAVSDSLLSSLAAAWTSHALLFKERWWPSRLGNWCKIWKRRRYAWWSV